MGKYLQGLTKKWHGLPIWAWAVIAGLVVYLGWRWYRSRNPSSANATPASASSAVQTPDSSGGYSSPGSSGDSGSGGGSSFFPSQSDQPLSNGYASGGYPYGFFGLGGNGLFTPFEIPSVSPQNITDTSQPVTNGAGTASTRTVTPKQTTSPVTSFAASSAGKAVVTAIKSSPSAGASGSAQTLLAASQGKVVKNTQAAKNIAGETTITPTVAAKAPVTAKTTPAPVKVTQPSGAGAVKAGTAKKNTQLIRAV